jgi:hypothetical protein
MTTSALFASDPQGLAPLRAGAPTSGSLAEVGDVKGLLKKDSRKGSLSRSPGVALLEAAACFTANIPCNTTVAGTLTTDDCLYPGDDSFYDAWQFQGEAGDQVRINMVAAYDTVLFLFNPQGNLAALNDDISGTNLNSRIEFTLNATGTWTIWANAYDDFQTGAYSLDLACTFVNPPPPPPTCTSSPTALCLNDTRFRVSVSWSVPSQGTSGVGTASALTSDTGYFWFFSANNIELVIKVVDGRAFNNFFWVFYGALSDVQYTVTVTDTATGAVRTYTNPQGRLASVADVIAFPGGSASSNGASAPSDHSLADAIRSQSQDVVRLLSTSAALVCLSDATTLCLNGGRFEVRVAWRVPSQGTSGSGRAVPLTSDTGYFWFFSANNVELVLKVVDGRAFNNFFWVFYGALSDVEYTITVTDTVTGAVKVYTNAQGQLASVADVAAF